MRLPRKKSEIDYTLALQKIEEALVHHACLFIRGAPGSGKSTLLEQVTKSLQEKSKKTISLRVPRRMDKNVAIHWLAESLQVASKGDEIHLLFLIQEKIESEKISLCIDDFDKIQNFESLASFFIKSLEEGSLIASSQAYPEVDILIEADAYFYDHAGLSKEQTSELVDRLGLNFESKELLEEFDSHTNGNAFLIRTALSFWRRESFEIKAPLVWDGAEQYLYEKAIVAAEEQLYVENLNKASLLKYDFARITSILRQGSPAFIRSLKELRLIEEDQNSLIINSKFRDFILQSISKENKKNLIENLLRETDHSVYIESKVEVIILLLKAEKTVEAKDKFIEHAEHILDCGLFNEILEITGPLKEILPPKMFYIRTRAMGVLHRNAEASNEISNFLKLHSKTSDCSCLLFSAAYNASLLGDRQSAITFLKKIIESNTTDLFIVFRAFIQLAVYHTSTNNTQASKYIGQAEDLISSNNFEYVDISKCQTDLLWAKAKLAWRREDRKLALKLLEAASLLERKNNRNYDFMFFQMLCLEVAFELNDLDYCKKLLEELNPLAQLYGGPEITTPIDIYSAEVQQLSGNLISAERIFQKVFSKISSDRLSREDAEYYVKYLNCSITNYNTTHIQYLKNIFSDKNSDDFNWQEVKAFRVFSKFLDFEKRREIENYGKYIFTELENLCDTKKIEVCAWLSEHFFQKRSFPKWFLDLQKIVSQIDQTKIIPHHLFQWQTNLSFALVMQGYYEQSRQFIDSINFGDSSKFYFLYRFRLNLWRAQICLAQNNPDQADKNLQQAQNILNEMEAVREESFFHAISAAIYLRRNQEDKAKRIFETQKHSEELQAVKFSLGFNLKGEKMPQKISIEFWVHFLKHCNLKKFERYQLVSSKETKHIYQKDLKSNLSKKVPILVNEVTSSCSINSIAVDFTKRQTLWCLFKLLLENFAKPLNKEIICTLLWQENYNPLIHDARIYTNVANLRKIFSNCGLTDTLVEKDGSYLLTPNLKFQWIKVQSTHLDLNTRQKLILSFLKTNPFLKRDAAQKITHSSPATIKRDLKELCNRGLIEMTGTGRASRYRLSATTSANQIESISATS